MRQSERIKLLDQDEVWVDTDGITHRLEDMDRHHRANLIPFLRGSAKALQRAAWFRYWNSGLSQVDNPSDGVWASQEFIEWELSLPAEDWLERTPLMRKLVELESGQPVHTRRATHLRNKAYELTHPSYRKKRLK